MKVEIRVPRGSWVHVPGARCLRLGPDLVQVELPIRGVVPIHAVDRIGVQIDGVEAGDVIPTDSRVVDGTDILVLQVIR